MGDKPIEMFTIKIPENISILRDMIKESNVNLFDARYLDLWKTSKPVDDLPSTNLQLDSRAFFETFDNSVRDIL